MITDCALAAPAETIKPKQRQYADAAADEGVPLPILVIHIHKAAQPYGKPASQSSNFIA